jgi:hypothetical protein
VKRALVSTDAAIGDAFFALQRSWHPNMTRTESDVMRAVRIPEVLLRCRSLKLWRMSFVDELKRRMALGVPQSVAVECMVKELHRDVWPPRQRRLRRVLLGGAR